jgi:hypothetical protein
MGDGYSTHHVKKQWELQQDEYDISTSSDESDNEAIFPNKKKAKEVNKMMGLQQCKSN